MIGDETERELLDLEWMYSQALDKEYRAEKRTKRRKPCNEIPADCRKDSLSWERFDFAVTYPVRLAQANRRFSGTYAQWVRHANRNGFDAATTDVEPRHDSAQDMLAELWCQQWQSHLLRSGGIQARSAWELRMSHPRQSNCTTEPETLPHGLASLLTPIESRVLALLLAGASERDISRQTGCYRENLPRIVSAIRSKSLPWALSVAIE